MRIGGLARLDEDDTPIGDYYSDWLIAGILVVELKAAKTLMPEHAAQNLGFLEAVRLNHGWLIDFDFC
jgi:GxxExxY protein